MFLENSRRSFLSAKTRFNYSRMMGRDGDGERSVLVIHVKVHHLSEAALHIQKTKNME